MKTVQITGPKDIVAILANAIKVEKDATKVAAMRNGMLASLSLCTVEVRNSANLNERWS